jgi:hypothetical protein
MGGVCCKVVVSLGIVSIDASEALVGLSTSMLEVAAGMEFGWSS